MGVFLCVLQLNILNDYFDNMYNLHCSEHIHLDA